MKTSNIGLVLLRIGLGIMMVFSHGLDKVGNFSQMSGEFPSVLGFSPKVGLAIAVFAEFFCALFVILGLFTRTSAAIVAASMAVAAFVVHRADSLATKELALLYFIGFTTIALLGAGPFSVDSKKSIGW